MAEKEAPLGRILVKKVRLSYFNGFEPFKGKDDKGNAQEKFSCKFLLPKERADSADQLKKIWSVIEAVRIEKWGKKYPKLPPERFFIRNGDDDGKEEYDGMWVISANNTEQPKLIDSNRAPLEKKDGKLYSGCWGHAIITVWAQDNQFGKRINASWEGVMFAEHDEAFSGRVALSDDDWSDVAENDEWDEEKDASSGDDDLL